MNRKHILNLLLLVFIIFSVSAEEIVTLKNGTKIIIYDDHTWKEANISSMSVQDMINKNKQFLRQGIVADENEIIIACEMYEQGWTYTMPRPKSSKAAWGVTDGRTTWYNGWWYNTKTGQYSDITPKKSSSGLFLGDNQNNANTWRNGGSPSRPDIFMFLLSKNGGPRF